MIGCTSAGLLSVASVPSAWNDAVTPAELMPCHVKVETVTMRATLRTGFATPAFEMLMVGSIVSGSGKPVEPTPSARSSLDAVHSLHRRLLPLGEPEGGVLRMLQHLPERAAVGRGADRRQVARSELARVVGVDEPVEAVSRRRLERLLVILDSAETVVCGALRVLAEPCTEMVETPLVSLARAALRLVAVFDGAPNVGVRVVFVWHRCNLPCRPWWPTISAPNRLQRALM